MKDQPCILVLGGGGFVGTHLRTALVARFGDGARIINTTRTPVDAGALALDIRDTNAVAAVVQREKPTHIINLVGIAAPIEARRNPALAWELHALAPDRLGRMLLQEAPDCWLFHVSSGLIYGRTALDGKPVDEQALLDPMDIYAVTKAAGDLAMGVLAGEGLKCLRLRPFNHTGPGQTEDFVVPAFAAQIARIKAGLQPPVMQVGNLDAERDFLDVRDVAAAYATLISRTTDLRSGSIYNIASGHAVSMREMLDRLIQLSALEISVDLDPSRQRPSDLPRIVGCVKSLMRDSGWKPAFSFDQTLHETLLYQMTAAGGSVDGGDAPS
ncbi:NAD-dependent epimerase/dehydratase family protein [Pseudorhodobacter sp. E13]|uniref:GDP-mannose 4,6-dehydratase n=1 Tax=Pseudorhodobacter sp. E13 TaxID=2487931 RepID=UPI000F8C85CD|nr:GDP-mannose 4,6-dehydratase [Pseudorhodobacter sp. E13]RUS65137.1 NAD-dependent epimerase/dehydratase family protein [Pseudorhodobacter sp. E13]